MDWSELPILPLLNVFINLNPKELSLAAQTCQLWYRASTSNSLWKRFCWDEFRVKENLKLSQRADAAGTQQDNQSKRRKSALAESQPGDFRAVYVDLLHQFGQYRHCYAQIKDIWARYHIWLAQHAPHFKSTLKGGASQDDINELEAKLLKGLSLPDNMKCSLMIEDGQKDTHLNHGLMGGYSFYDHQKSLVLLDVKRITAIYLSIVAQLQGTHELPTWLGSTCPVALSRFKNNIVFILLEDVKNHGKQGNILVPT